MCTRYILRCEGKIDARLSAFDLRGPRGVEEATEAALISFRSVQGLR